MAKQLSDKGGSEREIIELLSCNLWPGKELWRRRLRICESIWALKNETVKIMREVKELKAAVCNNCGKQKYRAFKCKEKESVC